jgi:hypothetical protein
MENCLAAWLRSVPDLRSKSEFDEWRNRDNGCAAFLFMHRTPKGNLLLLLLVPALLLAGCVNYEEEFAIELGGSGHIRSLISMKSDLVQGDGFEMKRSMETMFAKSKGLRLSHYDSRIEGKNRLTEFQIDFDRVESLKSVAGGEGGAEMARFFGAFAVEQRDDRYVMTRTIDLSGGFNGRNPMQKKGLARGVAEAVLDPYTFVYHMRFPVKVLGANSSDIDAKENKVTWRIPLTKALTGPVAMRAEVNRPPVLRWFLITGGSLVGIVVLAGGVIIARSRKRS